MSPIWKWSPQKKTHQTDSVRHLIFKAFQTELHAQTALTRPSHSLSPTPNQANYLQACTDVFLSASAGFCNMKAGSHTEKRIGADQQRRREICLVCLWDLKGGCDHAVSLDQSHLSASLSPALEEKHSFFFFPFWTSVADIRAALCLLAFVYVLNLLCTC